MGSMDGYVFTTHVLYMYMHCTLFNLYLVYIVHTKFKYIRVNVRIAVCFDIPVVVGDLDL